ncbi:DUF2589 domain-containing protein [Halarcobacter ebronensis]|uniref:DUF2589 domain-containing protein n=1 Tax=Halarcobacter ebronensis TaxID=1462615 RepID=A0A4Q1ANU6_9BACT|nr:DUF2589 domain-containing protein [Halarcobacter ebronensis]QKF82420.1 DUF2589 domain-containing protein [Halarcobacter ebronensis]RXK07557.1 hypothetical protein CRV07_03600 [Halarcobacter ebronensis]
MALGDEFKGLPMESLIGAPLTAACESNLKLAKTTAEFIDTVGFDTQGDKKVVRTAQFAYNVFDQDGKEQKVDIDVPLLAVVQIPSLKVDLVDITFDMEIRSSETSKSSEDKQASLSATGKIGYGPFSLKVSVSGSVSAHKENTRSTDKSAKYHVQVRATDHGMPEGLARVLDIMNKAIVPTGLPASQAKEKAITE